MTMADLFKIEAQRPALRSQIGGGYQQVIEVVFTTKPSGIEGKVDIPASAYGPDEVAAIVAAQAKLLESVQAL